MERCINKQMCESNIGRHDINHDQKFFSTLKNDCTGSVFINIVRFGFSVHVFLPTDYKFNIPFEFIVAYSMYLVKLNFSRTFSNIILRD